MSWIEVGIDGDLYPAVNYNDLTGKVKIGNTVVLNTTAVELSLGTGGYHFVMYNCDIEKIDLEGLGHIMKLRYTPYQIKCLVAEEESSPYRSVYDNFESLDGHKFVVCTLHSMIGPISSMIKWLNKDISINYIMTDGGSLPIYFSKTVKELKEKNIINKTITIGHAFGGDLECTNIYTGLIAAKEILKGDVTIISMGPGIVGTGTKYGFSGIEQGQIIDAINSLGGKPITVPRISFKDSRERHRGISHHTITVLSEIAKTSSDVVIPYLDCNKFELINNQIKKYKLDILHNIIIENGKEIIEAMKYFDLNITTMGRTIDEDLDYFITLGAVGKHINKLLT
ncbi:DUF3866 family protein [Tissierella simiarum]|uniref:DUF3866 family protein n=1 Tax=Tissierella simiarum TaxID=2841534 RepID=UPI0031B9B971